MSERNTNIIIYGDDLTKEDIRAILQAIRDAEQTNFRDKKISIFVSVPALSTQEMEEVIRSVEPGFATIRTFPTV